MIAPAWLSPLWYLELMILSSCPLNPLLLPPNLTSNGHGNILHSPSISWPGYWMDVRQRDCIKVMSKTFHCKVEKIETRQVYAASWIKFGIWCGQYQLPWVDSQNLAVLVTKKLWTIS